MSLRVRFSPDLGPWLLEGLAAGQPAVELARIMIEQQMEPRVACGIVGAFLAARRAGQPTPVDSVVLDEGDPPASLCEPPRMPLGSRIATHDRVVQVLARAESPVLAVLGAAVREDECAALIEMARPRLRPSTVVDPSSGADVASAYRSSLGMFFRLGENELVARLDRRVSEAMGLPVEHGEGFQVLHYSAGTRNAPHFDFLQPSNDANRASIARSGQRVSTLVAYLNDVEEGGETVFPSIGWTVSPRRGSAVCFEYCNRLGHVDPHSVHAGGAVVRGEKWVLTKWMRQRPFVPAGAAASDGMMG